ncbi:hypothetical protein [Pedobacter agri]|uniref:hypothetical protein n=1 Tax=Pedobacter agri TaxID=454586 RepID=UPI00292EA319|nr:hypothetical protein [Pedobacter agri]
MARGSLFQAPTLLIQIYVVPYYGVLSADGNTLYIDAYDFNGARITTSLSTFEWYGPKGVTPWLKRQ